MDVNQNAPADSSSPATTEAAPSTVPTDSAAYAAWRLTGKTEKPKEASAPSTKEKTPSAVAAEDAPTENDAPASEAADKQERKPRSNAETRVKELLEDLKRAGLTPAELKTFKREAKAEAEAEAAAAPEPEKVQVDAKAPVKPKIEDFSDYDKFEEAKDKYYEDLADHRAELKLAERDRKLAAAEAQKEINAKLSAARARYGDTAEQAISETAKAVFNDAAVPSAVKALINDSPVVVDLLYTLGTKDLAEFVALAKSNPGAAIRKAVLMEHLISEELGKTAAGDNADSSTPERDENGQFVKTPPANKKLSGTPPPPREASGRSAAPPDEVAQAFQTNDFTAYKLAQNRRDLATRQGK